MPSSERSGDAALYARQGFGAGLGIGVTPALLLVDFMHGFIAPDVLGSPEIEAASLASVPVLAFARRHNWPVAHSRIVFADDGSDANIFSRKVPSLLALTENAPISAIVPHLQPVPGELVIRKKVPSAFFGTDLAPWLTARAVDTLFVAGCVTSGCVRASVVDAMSCGFRTIVLEDCVGDRARAPHDASMFDMVQKNADIITGSGMMEVFSRGADVSGAR